MNKRKIIKSLRTNDAYTNFSNYESCIQSSSLIRLSFRDLINIESVSKHYDDVVTSTPVGLPFDNVLFDIYDYKLPHMLGAGPNVENIGLHMQPITVTIKAHKMVMLVVTDYRMYGKTITSKSYIIYADMVGLHIMPAVDALSSSDGCVCYKNNVFCNNPAYSFRIKDKLPGFRNEVGFALPDCSAQELVCSAANHMKYELSKLVKLLLAYVNLPHNMLVEVTRSKKNKNQNSYYIVVDEHQLCQLETGNKDAELYGNSFIDGETISEFVRLSTPNIKIDKFTTNHNTYKVHMEKSNVSNEASPEKSQEKDGG